MHFGRNLFVKVTGLQVHQCDALCEAGAFPKVMLNQAIGSIKRQESFGLAMLTAETSISDYPAVS